MACQSPISGQQNIPLPYPCLKKKLRLFQSIVCLFVMLLFDRTYKNNIEQNFHKRNAKDNCVFYHVNTYIKSPFMANTIFFIYLKLVIHQIFFRFRNQGWSQT